ncbi:carbonic anhydrase [Flagelloscypha sp. PMI_526]|nr:carbonic anhydrase [Flagelloscypha sp. PMI_526]
MTFELNHPNFIAWNKRHIAEFGDTGKLSIIPTKKLAIITCMDTRVNPQSMLGLGDGEALTIRNAGGGVTEDVFRTLVVAQRLAGAREIAVFHHTGCGGTMFTNETLQAQIAKETPSAVEEAKKIDFLGFGEAGVEGSVKDDVRRLKASTLLLEETVITGWVYETHSGNIYQVA